VAMVRVMVVYSTAGAGAATTTSNVNEVVKTTVLGEVSHQNQHRHQHWMDVLAPPVFHHAMIILLAFFSGPTMILRKLR